MDSKVKKNNIITRLGPPAAPPAAPESATHGARLGLALTLTTLPPLPRSALVGRAVASALRSRWRRTRPCSKSKARCGSANRAIRSRLPPFVDHDATENRNPTTRVCLFELRANAAPSAARVVGPPVSRAGRAPGGRPVFTWAFCWAPVGGSRPPPGNSPTRIGLRLLIGGSRPCSLQK